jgi:hypothetical protein
MDPDREEPIDIDVLRDETLDEGMFRTLLAEDEDYIKLLITILGLDQIKLAKMIERIEQLKLRPS